jgi:DNA-binding IclR family transcriptional regulator
VLDVLEFLAEARDGFTLATLSRRLRVPKSSLLALLRTFVERRYLEQPEPGGAYRLGSRAAQLGLRPAPERELPEAAAPALRELAERTGESVFLGVLAPHSREVVYIHRVESRERLRYTAELGERRPLHCSAPGLAILALLPDTERARLTATLPLRPYTAPPSPTGTGCGRASTTSAGRASPSPSTSSSSAPAPSRRPCSIATVPCAPPAPSSARPRACGRSGTPSCAP